jgi:hypothetical protein
MGLKYSNGSRQATQRYSALHAVEPKPDSRSVSALPQRGQSTRSGGARRTMRIGAACAMPPAPPAGGAIP